MTFSASCTRLGLSIVVLAAAACGSAVTSTRPSGAFAAEARDTITRSYPIASGGVFDLRNANGTIRVTAGGNTVELTATRIARATDVTSARNLLARLEIADAIAPDRVQIDSPLRQPAANGRIRIRGR